MPPAVYSTSSSGNRCRLKCCCFEPRCSSDSRAPHGRMALAARHISSAAAGPGPSSQAAAVSALTKARLIHNKRGYGSAPDLRQHHAAGACAVHACPPHMQPAPQKPCDSDKASEDNVPSTPSHSTLEASHALIDMEDSLSVIPSDSIANASLPSLCGRSASRLMAPPARPMQHHAPQQADAASNTPLASDMTTTTTTSTDASSSTHRSSSDSASRPAWSSAVDAAASSPADSPHESDALSQLLSHIPYYSPLRWQQQEQEVEQPGQGQQQQQQQQPMQGPAADTAAAGGSRSHQAGRHVPEELPYAHACRTSTIDVSTGPSSAPVRTLVLAALRVLLPRGGQSATPTNSSATSTTASTSSSNDHTGSPDSADADGVGRADSGGGGGGGQGAASSPPRCLLVCGGGVADVSKALAVVSRLVQVLGSMDPGHRLLMHVTAHHKEATDRARQASRPNTSPNSSTSSKCSSNKAPSNAALSSTGRGLDGANAGQQSVNGIKLSDLPATSYSIVLLRCPASTLSCHVVRVQAGGVRPWRISAAGTPERHAGRLATQLSRFSCAQLSAVSAQDKRCALASIAGVCSSLQRMASAQQQVALHALQAQLAAAPPGSQVAHSLQGLVRVAHAQLEQGQQQQQQQQEGSAPLMVLAQVQEESMRPAGSTGKSAAGPGGAAAGPHQSGAWVDEADGLMMDSDDSSGGGGRRGSEADTRTLMRFRLFLARPVPGRGVLQLLSAAWDTSSVEVPRTRTSRNQRTKERRRQVKQQQGVKQQEVQQQGVKQQEVKQQGVKQQGMKQQEARAWQNKQQSASRPFFVESSSSSHTDVGST